MLIQDSSFTSKIDDNRVTVFYNNQKLKEFQIPGYYKDWKTIVVGKVVLEYNPIYTTQYSTTQGLPAVNIFNHYDVPLRINSFIINPHCHYRYTGTYNNGIPYGEILISSLNERVCIANPTTDIHFGLVIVK